MTIKVLLADDEAMVRSGFRMILNAADGMEVVAEAGRGDDALRLAKLNLPDVCLLDIRMPGLDGIEVTKKLTSMARPPHVVLCTTFEDDEYVQRGLQAGAVGFLVKDGGPELLVAAVRAAAEGKTVLAPQITGRILSSYLASHLDSLTADSVHLTGRELAIASGVARGMTNQEIAAQEHVAVSTVKTQLRAVQRKIGARNRVEVAVWARDALHSP